MSSELAKKFIDYYPFAEDWIPFLEKEFSKRYFEDIHLMIQHETSKSRTIYPHLDDVFRVFYFPLNEIKVVIVGQDPYHNGHADGFAFSSKMETFPKSLQVINDELTQEFGTGLPSPSLLPWAQQGVFLLNTILTVRQGEARSHHNFGWQNFTRRVIKYLVEHHEQQRKELAFLLWGKEARAFRDIIEYPTVFHHIHESAHPMYHLHQGSGFIGNAHFKVANLYAWEPIQWVPGLTVDKEDKNYRPPENTNLPF